MNAILYEFLCSSFNCTFDWKKYRAQKLLNTKSPKKSNLDIYMETTPIITTCPTETKTFNIVSIFISTQTKF